MHSRYEDERQMRDAVDSGAHRSVVGGLWDEIGELQLQFLRSQGLRPEHRLLDIGCGAGRAAVKIAPYLNPGNYYGLDISPALLSAAEKELAAIGCAGTLRATPSFGSGGWPRFDFAIAQSVFTHVPLVALTTCLRATQADRMFATFFIGDGSEVRHPSGVVTHADCDPFHASVNAIECCARDAGWDFTWIGEWGHPRGQQIGLFVPASDGGAHSG